MCTVTVVPFDDGFRLACNRDERLDRPAGSAPTIQRLPHDRIAIYPVDPAGGGTWVGVNDSGLAIALLNRTIDTAASPGGGPLRSRGLIPLRLLGCRSLTDALDTAAGLDPAEFGLLRLVIVQHMAAVVLTSNGLAFSVGTMSASRPFMLTSSSLGDALVERPRARLFERLVPQEEERVWLSGQTRFHAHRWPSRAHISVAMERPGARTVSRTCITVTSHAIELCYDPLDSSAPLVVSVAGTAKAWEEQAASVPVVAPRATRSRR